MERKGDGRDFGCKDPINGMLAPSLLDKPDDGLLIVIVVIGLHIKMDLVFSNVT